MRKILFIALAILLCPIPAINIAQAKTSVVLSPPFQNITLPNSQKSVNFQFTLDNQTDKTLTLKISTQDFQSLNEEGGVAFLGDGTSFGQKYGLLPWITIPTGLVVMNPGQKQIVTGTINNDDKLTPGGHYAAVVASLDQSNTTNKNEVTLVSAISTLLFVNKTGGEQYKLELDSLNMSSFLVKVPTEITARFHNTGNVHEVPRGTVTLTDLAGRQVAQGTVNVESAEILPDSYRQIRIGLNSTRPTWLPGRYKLQMQYRYDGTSDVINVDKTIWLIPTKFLIGLLVLIGLILIWARFRMVRKTKPQI